MAAIASPKENVVVLNVGFDVYTTIVAQTGNGRGPRAAYDGEYLELMSPSTEHERCKLLFDTLIIQLGIEWELNIEPTGSATLIVKPRGAEPDSSFYVNNDAFRLTTAILDLGVDPPPDIVIEIDLSHSRIDKQAIYGAIGVPEFWRFDGKTLRGFELVGSAYVEVARSAKLKGLPIETLATFVDQRSTTRRPELIAAWQSWLRANRPE